MSILSKNGNCTYLGPSPCLLTKHHCLQKHLVSDVVFWSFTGFPTSHPHLAYTLSKEGSGNWESVKSENVPNRLRESRYRYYFHWPEQRPAECIMNPLLVHMGYFSLVVCCTLYHLILQILKQFLPLEPRARTSWVVLVETHSKRH